MKNNINTITWIFFMLFSFLTFGQTEELEYFRGDEFQYFDRIQDLNAPLGRNGELEDFSFTWGNNSFTVAIHNRAVLHEAQINAQRDRWYRRQLDLIKKHLEEKYNRSYTSYDEAKNDVFLRTERDHIYRNSRAPRSKYYRLINDGEKKVTYNIGNLKAFEIRRAEIQSGNIHNSEIPFMYINGTSLADITSVSVLNNYTATHTDYLKFLISEKHVNTTIVRKIEALPGDVNFESYVLNLKNDYYNGFNDWDRLNLMQFFLNYEHIKKYLSPPYILPTQFSSFYGIDKATPTNIEDYARRNRGGGQHLLANKCRIYVPGPQPTYMDIPTCLEAQRNYIDKLLNSTNSLDALAEKAIQGLGTRNVNFLNARPDLKQKVIDYFKANNFSRFSHNGINWLLNRFQDTNTLPLDANLLKSATTPLFQDATNPDRALQISFNQQAITEGITNFGNVLAELLKDNVNVAFEGSVIRAFFEANGIYLSNQVINSLLGNYYKFSSNDGNTINISFEDSLGNYLFDLGINNHQFLIDLEESESILFLKHLRMFQDTPIKFSKLWENYDDISGTHLIDEDKNDFSNYCSINLSHALLNSGFPSNKFKGNGLTKCWGCISVNNAGNHAIRAQELADWLKKNSGRAAGIGNAVELTGANFESYINGKKGIIFFKDYWRRKRDLGTNRTGDHIDLWDGNELAGSSWFWTRFRLNLPWVAERFGTSDLRKSKQVLFWEVKN